MYRLGLALKTPEFDCHTGQLTTARSDILETPMGGDCGDQFSRQRDLVSSEEINRDSVKNDEGPPWIQLAWNIFPV